MTAQTLDDRMVDAAIGALEMFSIHLGRRLGLYTNLTTSRTVLQLAEATGIAVRYAREWLEQQAVAGFVKVDDPGLRWDERRYTLADHQRAAFVDADDPTHVSPLADMLAGVGGALGEVIDAYRAGTGVPYADYGSAFRWGQGGINRPALRAELADVWLAAVPDVVERLRTKGGAIADLGCGTGWATIALAAAFPDARVVGYDSDRPSIADAYDNARKAGVSAEFHSVDAAALNGSQPYDLIVMIEALHDMADPVGVLRSARQVLAPAGALVVADEKVADEFTAPGDELERMMYGWSVLHCLPASLAEPNSAGVGTVLRSGHLRMLAEEAGFASVERSDIDAGFFSLYVLRN